MRSATKKGKMHPQATLGAMRIEKKEKIKRMLLKFYDTRLDISYEGWLRKWREINMDLFQSFGNYPKQSLIVRRRCHCFLPDKDCYSSKLKKHLFRNHVAFLQVILIF